MQNIVFDPVPAGLTPASADGFVRALMGALTTGVSVSPRRREDGTRSVVMVVHLLDSATPADVTKLQSAAGMYGVMTVTADKLTILADDTDMATITCADARINSDPKVDYRVYLGGVLYSQGVIDVVAGSVSLELVTAAPGVYTIEIARRRGNYATGLISIEAV